MGHDISPIGNHKLNIENITSLAEDITSRININIEYGYWGNKEHFKLLGENKEDQRIVIGKIIKNKDFKTFRLTDQTFQLKELHSKFGDDLFYNPEYWIDEEGIIPELTTIQEEKKVLIHPSFELSSNSDTESLSIYKEFYSNNIPYYLRWWPFCKLFTQSNFDKFEYLSQLIDFRKELMDCTLSFGGNRMYYLDDQSEVLEGIGQGSEWELNWTEFENFVTNKTAHLMLNIPMFLTDRNYRNQFIAKNEYPLSFIDDFSDIK